MSWCHWAKAVRDPGRDETVRTGTGQALDGWSLWKGRSEASEKLRLAIASGGGPEPRRSKLAARSNLPQKGQRRTSTVNFGQLLTFCLREIQPVACKTLRSFVIRRLASQYVPLSHRILVLNLVWVCIENYKTAVYSGLLNFHQSLLFESAVFSK